MANLPTLDFALYTSSSKAERHRLAKALIDSFKTHGFVKLVNHGFPDETVQKLLQFVRTVLPLLHRQSNSFFSLPEQVRNDITCVRGPRPQRGWSRVGWEQTSVLWKGNTTNRTREEVSKLTDDREHFDCGPPDDDQYPNLWPPEDALPDFRHFIEISYKQLQAQALEIISAMELGLDLEPGALVDRCHPAHSELRLNHYPPTPLARLADGRVKRTWPHTDFGIITLLFQDHCGGLELEDRAEPGTFVPVLPTRPGHRSELVVNISDTMQRWTNGVVPAGVHRVSPPPAWKASEEGILPERHSCVFFFKASRNTSAGPLPQFVTEKNPARYDEITALQYQQRKTQELYVI